MIKEVQRLTHENNILKKGMNVLHKKKTEKEHENSKLARENYDFRTKVLPQLEWYKELAAPYLMNNVQ